jgi:hypothetical protein
MNEDGSSKDSRYASYAEHPDRLEKMSVSVTYRTGERLFTATSLRGIVRNPDDSVVGLEPAHPETLRVRPHRGNGRLDSILGARTRTAKQRAEAAELLQDIRAFSNRAKWRCWRTKLPTQTGETSSKQKWSGAQRLPRP